MLNIDKVDRMLFVERVENCFVRNWLHRNGNVVVMGGYGKPKRFVGDGHGWGGLYGMEGIERNMEIKPKRNVKLLMECHNLLPFRYFQLNIISNINSGIMFRWRSRNGSKLF